MAKYIRTPQVDIKRTRKVINKETEVTSIEESLQSRLLRELDDMLENNISVTKTRLAKETNIKGGSFKTYSAIFDDTIDMLRMFVLGTKEKTEELASVPDFDKLEEETAKLIQQHASRIDYLGNLYIELENLNPEIDINDKLDKLYDILDAYWAFRYTTSYIHQDFVGVNSFDDIDKKIENTYQYNQKLWKRYQELKTELNHN